MHSYHLFKQKHTIRGGKGHRPEIGLATNVLKPQRQPRKGKQFKKGEMLVIRASQLYGISNT